MKKKIIVSAFFGILVFTIATARGGEPCERMNKLNQWMKDSLNLTEAQNLRITAINDSACIKLKTVKADKDLDQDAKKAQMKEIMGNVRIDYKAVLTEEQLAQLKAHKKAHEGRHGKHEGNDGELSAEERAEKMTERMKMELVLSDEQSVKVKSANLELINARERIKNDATLKTDEDRKTAMKSAMGEYQKTVKNTLNNEQQVKWKELRKAHNRHREPGEKDQ